MHFFVENVLKSLELTFEIEKNFDDDPNHDINGECWQELTL
jgi:hypothetical protein